MSYRSGDFDISDENENEICKHTCNAPLKLFSLKKKDYY